MQQQQKVAEQNQVEVRRGSFPWIRVVVAFFIFFSLALLTLLTLLATGRVISTIWVIVGPLLIGLLTALIYILQWLFPLHPVVWRAKTTSPQPPSEKSQEQTVSTTGESTSTQASLLATTTAEISDIQRHQEVVIPAIHIFHCNEPQLPNPVEYYGRAYERNDLIHRTSIRASTAIDGEHRIGKSWLMQYLQQVAPTHPQLGPHVRVGKFSAANPQCQTPTGFVKCSLEVLKRDIHSPKMTLERLAVAAKELKNVGILPVLCIDEFAGLIGKQGFDQKFLSELRSVAEDEGLVLVIASKLPLHEVIEHITGQTSPLFNIMPRLALKSFTELEARDFIDTKGQQLNWNQDERAFSMECAAIYTSDGTKGWPPLRLQLAGKLLLEDKSEVTGQQPKYDVNNTHYKLHFKERLDKQYRAIVKHS